MELREFRQPEQEDFLDEVSEGMAMIRVYVGEAAQRLGIELTNISWGDGESVNEGSITYPLTIASGSVSRTLEFPLQVLADYPGGRGYVKPTFHVDKMLRELQHALA